MFKWLYSSTTWVFPNIHVPDAVIFKFIQNVFMLYIVYFFLHVRRKIIIGTSYYAQNSSTWNVYYSFIKNKKADTLQQFISLSLQNSESEIREIKKSSRSEQAVN